MRKILTFSRDGIAAVKSVARRAKLLAISACLAVTVCMASTARAQTLAQYLAPTASSTSAGPVINSGPASGQNRSLAYGVRPAGGGLGSSATPQGLEGLPTVDASYSLLNDATKVVQAQGSAFIPGPKNDFDPCTAGCDVSWYVGGEALWLKRESDNNFSLSRNVFMPTWDYELGGRYTIGRLFDCTNGWEFVYAGEFSWDRGLAVTGPGNLQSTFFPTGGYTNAEVSAFNNADSHVQTYEANLNSLEINRRWWVWDVISTAVGVRYVDYDEDFTFTSVAGADQGVYINSASNQLLGLQLAADLIYPVALRGNVGFRFKGGVYANFAQDVVRLDNAGTLILNAGSDRTDWAGVFEYGIFGNYAIVPSVRLTAGYEFWWLPGIATVPEQEPQFINPGSGSFTQNEDNLILHGGSIGLEILF